MNDEPAVSVIIPTHNRSASLQRTLDGLCAQTYSLHEVEVIVVADGCTDKTAEALRHYEAPFALRVIEQPNQGPAAARNRGAAQAKGRFLIFVDDDIESTPSFIEAHVQTHADQPGGVVIGYLATVIQEPIDAFKIELRDWWEEMFRPLRQPGYRYGFWNLLSGNFSLAADLFASVGGFDTTLRCHEDYELGIRLIKAGARFMFAANAMGYHHEVTDLCRSLQRKFDEGRVDVMIGRQHPDVLPSLPLVRFRKPWSPLSRRMRSLAFAWPAGGDVVATGLTRILHLLEWAHLRRRWRRLLNELLDYWYWRGVAEELGTQKALRSFLKSSASRAGEDIHEIELDLKEGLDAAERRLDEERPAGVRVRYGRQPVGRISPQPGAEPLCGAHLRPILADKLAEQLIVAMAMEVAANSAPEGDRQPVVPGVQRPGLIYAPQGIHQAKRSLVVNSEGGRLWQ